MSKQFEKSDPMLRHFNTPKAGKNWLTHRTRILLAAMLGNLIECFDMAMTGLLSIYIAKYLIGDTTQGLLIVFITFFAGYLARPIGATLMGLFSDIYGRKIVLAISILSMGIATALIGIIPPQSIIGTFSVAALLVLRILQSFSCGAEYLNAAAYLVENAEPTTKGFTGCWASFGAMTGLLLSFVAALLVSYFSKAHPNLEWIIWRLLFIFALVGSSIGLYIRLRIPESMEYVMYYAEHPKPKIAGLLTQFYQYITEHKLKSLYVFALSCLGVASNFQIYIYAPTQAHLYGNFTDYQIYASSIISLIVLLMIFPMIGRLADRINPERIIFASSLGFLFLSKPYFYTLSYGNYGELLIIQSLIAASAGAYYASMPVMISQMFPIHLRCTVLSVLYSVAASLSAGLTPLVSLMLMRNMQSATAPAVLMILLVGFVLGMMGLRYFRDQKTALGVSI